MPNQMYLSTLSPDAPALAEECGLGLELDHFCTAANMDENFAEWDAAVRADMRHARRFVLHAPFAEIAPSAIDPLIREVSMKRLAQAIGLCRRYGVNRMVAHSGFLPRVYFPQWYVSQAAAFFRELLEKADDDFELLIENVLEPEAALLTQIVRGVDDPRLRICLDLGHANTFASKEPPEAWLRACAPFLSHVHLHNNEGGRDLHAALMDGKMDCAALLRLLAQLAPEATCTLELMQDRPSLRWLEEQELLE